eukprot:m.474248 g.474248  ORF g.474248 m.474248 type:complete len:106 (+) comp20390_c5_seq2:5159-5476(+)
MANDGNKCGNTLLLQAAMHGRKHVVRWLVSDQRVPVTQTGRTPLLLAAGAGHLHLVKWLLSPSHHDDGGGGGGGCASSKQADNEQCTALLCAAYNGQQNVGQQPL